MFALEIALIFTTIVQVISLFLLQKLETKELIVDLLFLGRGYCFSNYVCASRECPVHSVSSSVLFLLLPFLSL